MQIRCSPDSPRDGTNQPCNRVDVNTRTSEPLRKDLKLRQRERDVNEDAFVLGQVRGGGKKWARCCEEREKGKKQDPAGLSHVQKPPGRNCRRLRSSNSHYVRTKCVCVCVWKTAEGEWRARYPRMLQLAWLTTSRKPEARVPVTEVFATPNPPSITANVVTPQRVGYFYLHLWVLSALPLPFIRSYFQN